MPTINGDDDDHQRYVSCVYVVSTVPASWAYTLAAEEARPARDVMWKIVSISVSSVFHHFAHPEIGLINVSASAAPKTRSQEKNNLLVQI